eukprot:5644863-Amphidinium_carterae.1
MATTSLCHNYGQEQVYKPKAGLQKVFLVESDLCDTREVCMVVGGHLPEGDAVGGLSRPWMTSSWDACM